jgi:hypothetical protein
VNIKGLKTNVTETGGDMTKKLEIPGEEVEVAMDYRKKDFGNVRR